MYEASLDQAFVRRCFHFVEAYYALICFLFNLEITQGTQGEPGMLGSKTSSCHCTAMTFNESTQVISGLQ